MYARHLSGEAADSLQNSRVSTNTGPLHPFGIDFAIDYVQREMQGYGVFSVIKYYCLLGI